jgi:type VI secretion system protein ImpM
MACGVFGKLPAKRDFVALEAPRAFLALWEPWLQGSMSASMLALGSRWKDAYLMAPLWRFWLGPGLCGSAAIGVLMPSLDGVGRYFPLSAFALAPAGSGFPHPTVAAQDAWFEALEDLCLTQLEPDASWDAFRAGLAAHPDPLAVPITPPVAPERIGASELWQFGEAPAPGPGMAGTGALMQAIRQHDEAGRTARSSLWWTVGGGGHPRTVLRGEGLPEAALFATLLTGAAADGMVDSMAGAGEAMDARADPA